MKLYYKIQTVGDDSVSLSLSGVGWEGGGAVYHDEMVFA